MPTFVKESITEVGVDATYNAADSVSDTFANDGRERTFLHVKNANGGAPRTVTVSLDKSTTTKEGFGPLTKAPMVVTIPLSEDRFMGPFPRTAYGPTPIITTDDETDVTIALLEI